MADDVLSSISAANWQAGDIDAINRYITTVEIRTPAAQAARDAWILWHDGTTVYDRYLDRATYDRARNARLAFDLANATTDAERAAIMNRALTGLSGEQLQGQPDRRTSGGTYSEKSPVGVGSRIALAAIGVVSLAAIAKRWLMR